MKLVSFIHNNVAHLGTVVRDRYFSFKVLSTKFLRGYNYLDNIKTYLNNLPESFYEAKMFYDLIVDYFEKFEPDEYFTHEQIRILPPLEPEVLLDFSVAPQHLLNSAQTLYKYEYPPVIRQALLGVVRKKIKKLDKDNLSYYKGNHKALSGHKDTLHWPAYTQYLDIEPELAIVIGRNTTGKTSGYIAGYTIFNDVSARDVQLPELMGLGPARSKDFRKSNGLGPVLVTPDELVEPLNLQVRVKAGKYFWKGTTASYIVTPQEILEYYLKIDDLRPGTVIGMGTIPGCCGLDNDLWLEPGDTVKITFEKIGTLEQYIPGLPGNLQPSRWKQRFSAPRR